MGESKISDVLVLAFSSNRETDLSCSGLSGVASLNLSWLGITANF